MKKILFLSFALLLCFRIIFAVNVENEPINIKQPNGIEYQLFVTGDEFFNWVHDDKGYVVCHANDGYYYYALKWENKEWVPSNYKVGEINPATKGLPTWDSMDKAAIENYIISAREEMHREINQNNELKSAMGAGLTNGHSTALLILIRFSDQTDFSSAELNEIDSMMSAKNKRSVYTYYQEVSYGKMFLDGHIIRNHYVDAHPRSYYLKYNATSAPNGYKDDTEKRARRKALLQNAVNYISDKVPTDLNLDMNSDNKIDFVSFIIRGKSQKWGDLLWAHASGSNFNNVKVNGMGFGRYNFMPENQQVISTFTHEFYHNMGAPDVYRYTNKDISPAPKMFADYNHMCSYYKWKHSDKTWIKEIPEISQSGTYSLFPLANYDNSGSKKCSYKIRSPHDPLEYFIVEYRKKDDYTQDFVNKSGVIIYRINPKKHGNGAGPPDEIYVYRTNGTYLHDGKKTDIYYGASTGLNSINDNTNPSSFLSNGFTGGLNIENVTVHGDSATFTINMQPQTKLLSGGIFSIENSSSKKLVGTDTTNVTCNTDTINSNNQWVLDYISDGTWKIIHKLSKKVLSIKGNANAEQIDLVLTDYLGTSGQKWYLFNAGTDKFRIVSTMNKDFCVYNSGGKVKTIKYSSTNENHKWAFSRIGNYVADSVSYLLMSKQSGKSAEVYQSTGIVQK
ncbi:MAG: RICIN domain-containing protein, partial [Bacteroidales bacterium]|nr:RICIN domain-containing protein [Bacteroidales bacterium]